MKNIIEQVGRHEFKMPTKQTFIRVGGAVLLIGASVIPNFACAKSNSDETGIVPKQKITVDLRTGDNATAVDTKAIGDKAVAEYIAEVSANATAKQALVDEAKRQLRAEAQKELDERGFSRPVEESVGIPADSTIVYSPSPESEAYGDFFSVRFNPNTNHYDLVDVRTKRTVDTESFKVQPISYKETGKGKTSSISYYLNPGEAALVQGFTVNGLSNGFYGLRINGSNNRQLFTDETTDGSVKIIPIKNAAANYTDALNTAVDNSWAHGNLAGAMSAGY